jgi:hypothetical protein
MITTIAAFTVLGAAYLAALIFCHEEAWRADHPVMELPKPAAEPRRLGWKFWWPELARIGVLLALMGIFKVLVFYWG